MNKHSPSHTFTLKNKTLQQLLLEIIGVLIFIILAFFVIFRNFEVGGGATFNFPPDFVHTGEPAIITFEVTVPGSQRNIEGRYTDIIMHYSLAGSPESSSLIPQFIDRKENRETYEFIIPPYPLGTEGEITYIIEFNLDNEFNRISSYKNIPIYTDNQITSSASPVPTILVELESYGGRCVYGACSSKSTIYSNGTVQDKGHAYNETTQSYEEKITERHISETQLEDLKAKIQNENLDKVREEKFTGTCPVAYDGQAFTYTIYKNNVPEILDSCEYIIDQPLFETIHMLVFGEN